MDINLTGNVWGWPIELIGKISGVDFTAPGNITVLPEITLPVNLNITEVEFLEQILPEIKTFITLEIAVAVSVGIIVGSAITIIVIFIRDFLENRRKIQADRAKVHSRLNGEKIHLMQSFKYIGNIRLIKIRNEKIFELAKFREKWWKDLGLASTLFDIPKEYFLAIEISESSLVEELENNQIDHTELNKLMNNLEDNMDALLLKIEGKIKTKNKYKKMYKNKYIYKYINIFIHPYRFMHIFNPQKFSAYFEDISDSKEKIRWILKNSGGKIKRSKLLRYMEIEDSELNNILGSKDSEILQSSSDKEMIVLVDKLQ